MAPKQTVKNGKHRRERLQFSEGILDLSSKKAGSVYGNMKRANWHLTLSQFKSVLPFLKIKDNASQVHFLKIRSLKCFFQKKLYYNREGFFV